MLNFNKMLFLINILAISVNIFAQNQNFKFRHLTVEDGLSHGWIRCIYKDSYGYMWFGTGNSGLNKYDGSNFTIFENDPENKNSLSTNSINFIYEDKKRNLWIGTNSGLNVYNRELDNIIPIPSFNSLFVNDIYELDNGNFYLATQNNLILFDPKNNSMQTLDKLNDNISFNFIKNGILQYNNKIIIGADQGLFNLDTTYYKLAPIFENIVIRSIIIDDYNRIWFGTKEKGLFCLTFKNNDFSKPVIKNFIHTDDINSISEGSIEALQIDYNNNLWIGTSNDGLNILDLNNLNYENIIFQHCRNNPSDIFSLSHNSINTFYLDNEGTVWVSTYNSGISFYNNLSFKFDHVKHEGNNKNSLNDNQVNAIYEDDHYLWIGTQKGLNVQNRQTKKWEHYEYDENNNQSLGAKGVCAIFRDSRKKIWIGTWAGGLNLFNESTKTFSRFLYNSKDASSINNNNIFDIKEDENGIIWIATCGGGLNKFDYKTKSFKNYRNNPDPDKQANKYSNDIEIIKDNDEIYIAASGGFEIFTIEEEEVYHFVNNPDNPKSLSSNGVICILKDSKSNIWLGTDNGLNLFNRDSSIFKLYNKKDGLPNNVIRGICEDDHGNLWISTNKGISKFINGINDPESPQFENYDIEDGLQGNTFNARSCFKSTDGKIYFGGTNGFNVFHPDSIKKNPYLPDIVFTNLLIFNKPVKIGEEKSPLIKHISLTKQLTFTHDQSVITIEYAALNYLGSEKTQYAYIMEGFEKEWNYVQNKREATYTNLDPGEYIFRVKATNSDGIWNEKGTYIKIIITPPFWQTTWFRILVFIVIVGSVYLLYKYRIRSMEAHRKELEMKVEERTHQLSLQAEELTQSNLELELSKKDLEEAKKETDNILENVKEGFFLLDKNLQISSQYSAILERIFCRKKLAQMNIIEFLNNKIPADDVENTKNYLELMFDYNIDDTQIADLNPLVDIESTFKDDGSVTKKYLNFTFRRIKSKKSKKIELIVTVRDVTEQILLSLQLKEEEERREKLLQLMLSILDVEPKMLSDFSESANRELTFIDDIMNHDEIDDYHNLLVKVQRSIHLVKGNARLLNIDFFAEQAHKFEDHVSDLLKSKKITDKDINPLRKRLTEIQTGMIEMESIIEKIGKVLSHKDKTKRSDAGMLLHSLENLINSFSKDLGKKIKFDYKNFKSDIIPERYHLLIKEVLIQLIRNSISHGIETPKERQKLKKPEYGVIQISTFTHNGSVGLKFRDDGRGLQLEKLKQRAIESGKWIPKEVEKWDKQQLAELIFTSGITTSDKADMVSGRGVGMDGVKHRLIEHSGQIQVHFDQDRYCEFEILLPSSA